MPSGASHYLVGDVGAGATVLQGEQLSVGFTAEHVRTLIEAATKGADERLAEVSRRLGVTQGAMRTMLATLGQADVPEERLRRRMALPPSGLSFRKKNPSTISRNRSLASDAVRRVVLGLGGNGSNTAPRIAS
jgi:hypothetical protein